MADHSTSRGRQWDRTSTSVCVPNDISLPHRILTTDSSGKLENKSLGVRTGPEKF